MKRSNACTKEKSHQPFIIFILRGKHHKTPQGGSIDNLSSTTRASTHLLLYNRNNNCWKENAWTRNEVHWRITDTPKRGVTSRDYSFVRERRNPAKNTVRACKKRNKYNYNKHNMLELYKRWKTHNEIKLTKNKMALNDQNMKNHPPFPMQGVTSNDWSLERNSRNSAKKQEKTLLVMS